jgi:hypothetical protein
VSSLPHELQEVLNVVSDSSSSRDEDPLGCIRTVRDMLDMMVLPYSK